MNLIHTVRFDFSSSQQELAKELQDKVFGLSRYNLPNGLEEIFNRFDGKRIERIELDLGSIPYASLDAQLIPKIISALENELANYETETSDAKDVDWIEVVGIYLEQGVLHWSQKAGWDLNSSIERILKSKPREFISFLRATPVLHAVAGRIGLHFSRQNYEALIKALRPTEADFVLGFMKDVTRIAEKRDARFWKMSDLSRELRAFILTDLVKNYGSFFNRKMFVRNRLMEISSRFRLDYEELLRFFYTALEETIVEFRLKTSLPSVVKGLIEETLNPIPVTNRQEPQNPIWKMIVSRNISTQDKELLLQFWPELIVSFPSEIASFLRQEVNTRQQVEIIVENIDDERTDDLIEILEPTSSELILSYKRMALKSTIGDAGQIAVNDLSKEVNVLILSFLLIDRGTRFNRKQFLDYQVKSIAQRYNLSYNEVLTFLTKELDHHPERSKQSELLSLLKELSAEISEVILAPVDLKKEDIKELLKAYLRQDSALFLATKISSSDFQKEIRKMLLVDGQGQEILDFILFEEERLSGRYSHWQFDLYLMLVELAIKERLKLKSSEKTKLFGLIKRKLGSTSNRVGGFEILLSIIRHTKLTRQKLMVFNLDSNVETKAGSLTFRYYSKYIEQIVNDGTKPSPDSGQEMSALSFLMFEYWKKVKDPTCVKSYDMLKVVKDLFDPTGDNLVSLAKLNKKQWKSILEKLNESELEMFIRGMLDLGIRVRPSSKSTTLSLANKTKFLYQSIPLLGKLATGEWPETRLKSELEKMEGNDLRIDWNFQMDPKSIVPSPMLDDFIDFLKTGKLRLGVTTDSLTASILEWHRKGDIDFIKAVKNISWSDDVLDRVIADFNPHVFLRLIQVFVGGHLNNFLSLCQDVEYLLEQSQQVKQGRSETRNLWWYRLRLGRLIGRTLPKFKRMFDWNLEIRSDEMRKDFQEVYEDVLTALHKKRDKILPSSRRKKVDALIQSSVKFEPEKMEEVQIEDKIEIKSMVVTNAGLVLFWPFLTKLFQRLEMLDEEMKFKSPEIQHHACRLLHFLATEDQNQPEYLMTLPKLLVGINMEDPMEAPEDIKEEEKELIIDMMHGLIANWDRMGNTSIEGLRNSFINRKGMLEKDDGDWVLNVEKAGVDVLLKYLPWGISNVKLPWNPYVIYVSWA